MRTARSLLHHKLAIFMCLCCMQSLAVENPPVSDPPLTSTADYLDEVVVTAREPRYVAPTRRDQIGRIWAPVYINDRGPFRFVLDTGASTSAITNPVAVALGVTTNLSPSITLRGATGSTLVPAVKIDSLVVGDLLLTSKRVPIIPNALGGAEGVLGTEGLFDKRIYIDFRRDLIVIKRSRNERPEPDFATIPVKFLHGKLLTTMALMGNVPVLAIIDTGAQTTVANLAARDALLRRGRSAEPTIDEIIGATEEVEIGEGYATPPIVIGGITIRSSHVTFGDMYIFKQWKLLDQPTILIGMDVLGLLDTLVIDYQRKELQLRVRTRN
jgi:Aspartyl protease